MAASTWNITPIDLRAASDEVYAALTAFDNQLRAERLPDDPPKSLEEMIVEWQNIPPFVELAAWCVWSPDGAAIIASSDVGYLRTAENQHVVQFSINVAPAYRRQGLGRELLALITEVPRREQRRLMIADTSERIPAGAMFLQRIGAHKGLETHTNQLDLRDLNHGLIDEWQARRGERAVDFELGCWDGPYPEAEITAIVALEDIMNHAPVDDLDIEDFHWTPEQLRQREQSMFARGIERWTLYARDSTTHELAGFTEVMWQSTRPTILQQGGTGVFPHYRNRGLGRWLKAAMLAKVLRERPEVQFVRTGNADSNDPMLHINHALGFKPYISECVWQVATDQVLAYLAGSQPAT